MEKHALIEYIEMLIDLEKNILLQNKTKEQINAQIASLKVTQEYARPVEPKLPRKGISLGFLICPILGILGMIWGISILGSKDTTLGGIAGSFLGGFFVIILSLVFLICGFLSIYSAIQNSAEQQRKYKSDHRNYEIAIETYEKRVTQEKEKRQKNEMMVSVLEQEHETIVAGSKQTRSSLDSLYAENIIWHKYRNLQALCAIYEYLSSGRVDTLGEAYNKFEDDIAKGLIISNLETIVSRLNVVIANQYTLQTKIEEVQYETSNLVAESNRLAEGVLALQLSNAENSAKFESQIEELKRSSATTAYFTERAAKELHYMNRMDYLAGRNDGTVFNLPPT